MFALSGKPARGTYPASYLYRRGSHFNAVRSGANGRCESSRQYLCSGRRHYSGPAGVGTPDGTGGFSSGGARVTLVDPGTQDVGAGSAFRLTLRAVDSDMAARSLTYSVRGLPGGLTIRSSPRSPDAAVTGRLPAHAGSYQVLVTAKDRRTHATGSTRFDIYVIPSLTAAASVAPGPGSVEGGNGLDGTGCLSAATPPAVSHKVVMDFCDDASVSQQWGYFSGAAPGAPGSLTIAPGICLGLDRSGAVLQTCNGSRTQKWEYLPSGAVSASGSLISLLYNPASGRCLNGGNVTVAGERVTASRCSCRMSRAPS